MVEDDFEEAQKLKGQPDLNEIELEDSPDAVETLLRHCWISLRGMQNRQIVSMVARTDRYAAQST